MSENTEPRELTKEGRRRLKAIWYAMNHRCFDENAEGYDNYGGAGITVCDAWSDGFMRFEKWAIENGYAAEAKRGECTIDRIDPFGDYTPENCRFVNMKEQSNNRKANAIHDSSDEILYAEEVAEQFNLPINKVVAATQREILPYMKIGSSNVYCRSVVREFAPAVLSMRENKTYHVWVPEEDEKILHPESSDIDEVAASLGIDKGQIRSRLRRLGTTWDKVIEGCFGKSPERKGVEKMKQPTYRAGKSR